MVTRRRFELLLTEGKSAVLTTRLTGHTIKKGRISIKNATLGKTVMLKYQNSKDREYISNVFVKFCHCINIFFMIYYYLIKIICQIKMVGVDRIELSGTTAHNKPSDLQSPVRNNSHGEQGGT